MVHNSHSCLLVFIVTLIFISKISMLCGKKSVLDRISVTVIANGLREIQEMTASVLPHDLFLMGGVMLNYYRTQRIPLFVFGRAGNRDRIKEIY